MNRLTNLLLCFLLLASAGMSPLYGQYMVRQLTNADGLSNNSVNCFFEDSRHTLWVGTWDGLNAYDGRNFHTYRYGKDSPGSISNNVIRQIAEQDGEHIWVATNYGISRWSRSTQLFDNYSPGTDPGSSKGMSTSYLIAVTSDGHVIACVKRAGFYLFDEAVGDFVPVDSPADPAVHYMIADRYQHLYILSEKRQLYRYRIVPSSGGIAFTEGEPIELGESVRDITLSDDKLVATHWAGVSVIDTATGDIRRVESGADRISSRTVYSKGGVFAITGGGDFMRCNVRNGATAAIEAVPQGLPVFSLYAGSQDIVWIGTDGQGIFQLYEYTSPFRTVMTDYPVRCFSEQDSGTMLVGTKGGGIKLLDRRGGTIGRTLTTADGLISNTVYSMRKNSYGDIFIGTEGEGLNYIRRNETTVRRLHLPPGAPSFKSVYSINFTGRDSVLWAGTANNGLVRIDLERSGSLYSASAVTLYTSAADTPSLSNNTIYSIVRGEDGRSLWLGTRGGGVDIFYPETGVFRRLEDMGPEITHNDVLSMQRSSTGEVWIGTGYGLNCVDDSETPMLTAEYTDADGLANNTIHGVVEDTGGNVWVSTNLGISFIDSRSGRITNYTWRNGLQDNEFSDGAYFMDSRGTIWFGGVRGLNHFNAEEISLRSYSPGISLSGLRINNEERNIHDRIRDNTLRLDYNEPYVTLSFVVADFINNENCVYSYRIAGFADQWVYNGNNPSVVITKLPPRRYRLEVRYTNGDRVWSDTVYGLDIGVGYPWWQSWWAYLLYVLFLAGIAATAYVVIRNRIKLQRKLLLEHAAKRNQQRIHESRLNFFTNIAHEFFTPLTLIYGPAQQLLEKGGMDDYSKRYVTMIKNNADRMQNLLGELMDFRKAESGHTPLHPEGVEVKLLVDYVSDNYSEIAGQNKIDFRIETDNLSTLVTDRNALEKIVLNLISNAFKYTPANGYILVRVSQNEDGTLSFAVRNSGKGLTGQQQKEVFNRFRIFETDKMEGAISTGIGLNLTKELANLMGGEITVESVPGEHVEFSVTLPPMSPGKAAQAESQAPAGMAIPGAGKDITILVVDDEPNIRELLRDILSAYYNIREAANGQEALEEVAANRPDIIITDIVMPVMDGIALAQALRDDENTAHIPLISISAKGEVEDRITALEHGTDFYITKPFHPRHVLVAVNNIISKHSLLKKYFTSSRSAVTVRDGIKLHHDDEQMLREIAAYIENNIDDESLSPTSISDFIGCSKASLYQKLKALTGKTPSEYVRIIRLEYAAKLLLTSQYTVSEIMYKSGFSSKSYFYKEFARQYGLSPKEYRKAGSPQGL